MAPKSKYQVGKSDEALPERPNAENALMVIWLTNSGFKGAGDPGGAEEPGCAEGSNCVETQVSKVARGTTATA